MIMIIYDGTPHQLRRGELGAAPPAPCEGDPEAQRARPRVSCSAARAQQCMCDDRDACSKLCKRAAACTSGGGEYGMMIRESCTCMYSDHCRAAAAAADLAKEA